MAITPVYSLRPGEVFLALETSPDGLSRAEADARLSLYGENILSEQKKDPPWLKIGAQFVHPLALLLLVAGFLAVFSDWVLALVIWALTFTTAGFSYWREYRAEQATAKLQDVLPAYAHLLRDGQEMHIPAREVVPGDILILAEGDNIPADARVVEEYGLRTNNATLTGESVAARKIAEACYQQGISELEQANLIFAGTSVAAGTGRAVVYATGMLTQFGRIAHLTQSLPEEPSPFQRELSQVVRVTTFVAIGLGALILAIGFFENSFNLTRQQLWIFALGVIVAATPEGLPATLTLSLARAVQRLTAKGVLVKKLNTVETLGSISIICTDKSGTLTQNQMTVREVWVARQRLRVTGVGYQPQGQFVPAPDGQNWDEDLNALLEAACSCNNARINPPSPEHPTWTSLGDQTEAALKVAGLKAGIDENELIQIYPRVHEIPFDARRKRMTTIHRTETGQMAFTKGAPREVLQLCTHVLIQRQAVALDERLRREIMAANDDFARKALRVLAIARKTLPQRAQGAFSAENVETGLVFLGLMAMMDPPRPEVEQAVQICRQAGIRIVMITGDYGLTAESLARRVGMIESANPRILTGAELDETPDSELQTILEQEVIFARMAPEHKLRLVAAFQARGEMVAVTGDGVNDAPALRKADVGVAMGLVGTDVAKEAADIILTDDNFGAIISAIEEGRAIYDNIRKFMTYIFSSNVPEVMPFIISASLPGIPLALGVKQILAIDLGTDLFPALALGSEPPEPDVMLYPPRKRDQRLLDNNLLLRAFLWLGMIEAVLCFGGFFAVYLFSGNAAALGALPWLAQLPIPAFFATPLSVANAQIMAVTVFHAGVVMAQVGNAFACRSEINRNSKLGWASNRFLLFGILAEIVSIFLLVYFPPLADAFEHQAIPARFWIGLSSFGLILYSLEWIRKQAARRRAG
ncbi:MAG: cation-transporting P-type ATPase [Anaerolineales bacterium]|jgi:magnesium-transporting ATPase (P-type)|nr:cation-transporting P-type ATPase [Anaerolineales bacterium]